MKKKKKVFWLALLIIILFIFFILVYFLAEDFIIKATVTETVYERQPRYEIREVTSTMPVTKSICSNVSHRYSYRSGNVDSIGIYVRPNLIVSNVEERWAFFRIKIYYVDDDKFPNEIYGGQNLFEKYEKGEISLDDADFSSEWFEFYIGPGESFLINNRTEKQDYSKTYWAMADIKVPIYRECKEEITYMNITQNKTFETFVDVEVKKKIKKNIPILEYLGISSLGEWIVILLMFILILILLLMIYRRNKYRFNQFQYKK